MNRRVAILMAAAIVVLIPVVGYIALWSRPGPNRVSFSKIREGMTKAEVEEILGGPAALYMPVRVPGTWTTGMDWDVERMENGFWIYGGNTYNIDPEWCIQVCFDESGVYSRSFPMEPTSGFWGTLRYWLNL